MEYLAVPYSHDNETIRRVRHDIVTWAAGELQNLGFHVFSPISHSHAIAGINKLPGSWDYWEEFDRKHISACDRVFVLCLPGWETSTGVQGEIKIAQELGKPVCYFYWEDFF